MRRTRHLHGVGAAATALALTLTAGCGGESANDKATTAGVQLVNPGTLTICTHLPYKPFEFRGENGKVVGFDMALLKLLAEELGAGTRVVDIGWSQITSGAVFAAEKCDVGMGAATITEERKKSVLFSDHYFDATQALLVRKEKPYKSLGALEGKKLGVQTDTTGHIYARRHKDEFGYTIVVYDDSITEFEAVKSGNVAAAINDNAPLYYFAKKNSDTMVTAEFDTGEHYGFMVEKNDKNAKKLVEKLNSVLAQAKQDGTYKKLFKKWFDKAPK